MRENSLFAVLLRSPWWLSLLIAAGIFGVARLLLPDVYAAIVPLPFVIIGGYAGWLQLRAPSAARLGARLDALRAMSWEEFSVVLEEVFQRQGHVVARVRGAAADFELTRAEQLTLVACKRWKAKHTGVEPLRELHAAAEARAARDSIYVAVGEVTAQARAYAAQHRIRLLLGVELAALLLKGARAKA